MYTGATPSQLGLIALTCSLGLISAGGLAAQPLIPFQNTGDLYVMEDGCGCILRITPEAEVSIAVSRAEVAALTGQVLVDLEGTGLAFTPDGTMYFVEAESQTIIRRRVTGVLDLFVTQGAVRTALGFPTDTDLTEIVVGSDGQLYVVDGETNAIVRVDPATGDVFLSVSRLTLQAELPGGARLDVEQSLAAGENGFLYAVNGGTVKTVFSVCSNGTVSRITTGAPITDPNEYSTRAPNGDILLVNDADPVIDYLRISPEGVVSTFLTDAQVEAVAGFLIDDSEGGFAFDSEGNFYIAEEDSDNILRIRPDLTGSVWVTADAIRDVTGETPDLEGQIAFASQYKLYFAQFADGQGALFSQITVAATDPDEPTRARIILKDNDGNPLTVDLNGEEVTGMTREFVVPAGGQRIFRTDGEGDPLVVGSVIVCSDKPMSGVILFAGVVGLAGVGSSPLIQEGFSGPIETDSDRGVNTGVALMNLESEPVTLDAELLDNDGNVVAEAQIQLPGMGHDSFFVTDIESIPWDTPPDFASFEGTLRIRTPGRISAIMIQTRPDQFATLPVTPLAEP